jgi:Fe-S-cluster-containing dehydrogenase component
VDRGLMPACADNVCPGHCIHFGDADEIHRSPMGFRTISCLGTTGRFP